MIDLFDLTRPGKYEQKNKYSCGYYCAKAMINSLGDGNDTNLKPLLKLTPHGVGQTNLIRTLRARKVGVSVHYDLTLSRMEQILSQGKYIIVYHHGKDHWLVLGEIRGKRMRFYDPEGVWGYEDSGRVFDALGNFGIVCSSKNSKR